MPSVTIPVPPATTLAICTLISLSLIGFLVYTVLSSPNPYKDRLREKVLIKPEPGEIPSEFAFVFDL